MILQKIGSLGGKQHALTYSKQNEYVVPKNVLLLDGSTRTHYPNFEPTSLCPYSKIMCD
jgi:hypothetical protein